MKKIIPPVLAILAGLYHAYEAIGAASAGSYGRMAWKGALAVVLVGAAWIMHDTGKRFSDS